MTKLLSATALALIMSASLGQARTYDWPSDRHSVADYSPIGPYRHRAAHRHVKTHRVDRFTAPALLIITRRPAVNLAAIPLPRPRPNSEPRPDLSLIEKARMYLGQSAAQIGVRRSLWCSAFLRKITQAKGVNDLALSWLGKHHTAPRVGVVAVMRRGSGGHVGLVSKIDSHGDVWLISGNHGGRVAESRYPRHRIIAFVSI